MRMARTQPPVGYRFPIAALLRNLYRTTHVGSSGRNALERELAEHFQLHHAVALSSGKAALTIILNALKALTGRWKVILPAYTCYSVPSSIAKAGLEIVPCDIARNSFDYDYDRLAPMLDDDTLCVLSIHLFGIPADTGRLMQLCRGRGIFVVEDAAQAMGGTREGRPLGTLGDVGFYSLGRGKAVTCGSGGVVLTDSARIADALTAATKEVPAPGLRDDVATAASLLLLSIFIAPSLYWFPASLPFLRLGETIFHRDFPVQSLSNFRAGLLTGWAEQLGRLNEVRRSNADFYRAHVHGLRSDDTTIPYLRFPVVLDEPEAKRRILIEKDGGRLGISGMYPSTVAGIPELEGRWATSSFPEAERVASALITLPTHPLVSESDRILICNIVNEAVAEPEHRVERKAS